MKVQVFINGKPYEVEVQGSEDDSPSQEGEGIQSLVLPRPGSVAATDFDGRIYRSPVAGLVVAVSVDAGQTVQESEELLVLEAMKMETRISAVTCGKVKCLLVTKGDAVKVNQVLLELE